jgi:hypothetical protein
MCVGQIFLKRFAIRKAVYELGGILRVATNSDADTACALDDVRHKVEECRMNMCSNIMGSDIVLIQTGGTYPFFPTEMEFELAD